MKLKITAADIRHAKRDDERSCPIARSFRRQHPGNEIQVWDTSIYVNGHRFEHTDHSKEYALDWNEGYAEPAVLYFPDVEEALKTP